MVKKDSRSIKKLAKRSVKKPVKKSSKSFSKKLKMIKSKKKRAKYLLQAGPVSKMKKKSLEFIEKNPVLENAILTTAKIERKAFNKTFEILKDSSSKTWEGTKTIASWGLDLFKAKPKPKTGGNVAAQEPQQMQTEFIIPVKLGFYGHKLELPESLIHKKGVKVEEQRYIGTSYEEQIREAINSNAPQLNNRFSVEYSPSKRIVTIKLK